MLIVPDAPAFCEPFADVAICIEFPFGENDCAVIFVSPGVAFADPLADPVSQFASLAVSVLPVKKPIFFAERYVSHGWPDVSHAPLWLIDIFVPEPIFTVPPS